jgi:hypothetical protein
MPRDADHGAAHLSAHAASHDAMCRGAGVALTFVVGPAAALGGAMILGMGVLESTAVLVLISGWLGPKLMRAAHV